MNTVRPGPKSHHYVPRGYLSRFSDDAGFVHIQDRRRNQFRRQRPNKLMKIDSYYRQRWAPVGIDPNAFENALGASLEHRAPALFDKLAGSKDALTEDEAVDLVLYLELQRIRVPRQAASGVELLRGAVLRALPSHEAAEVEAGRLQITMKDWARFDYMRMAIGTIHPWLERMEWEVIAASAGSSFITSDSPVCFYNPMVPPPAEAGLGLAGTIVFFPLSSSHMLLMRHPECRDIDALALLPSPDSDVHQVPLIRGANWSAETVASTNYKVAMLSGDLVAACNSDAVRIAGWGSNAASGLAQT